VIVAPFAVNQIVPSLQRPTRPRHGGDRRTSRADRDHIVGARPEINEAVHSYGGVVLHDVINDQFARKAVEKGADGIIAVAAAPAAMRALSLRWP